MQEIFLDALKDSARMIPLLLFIYIAIELVEYKFGKSIKEKIQKAGKLGPLIGALVGGFPQCGFSVIITALYTQRLVTIGTLLAVYLSTSDEAIPIILSQPDKAHMVLPLIMVKIIIALVAGYAVDLIFRKRNKKTLEHIDAYASGKDDKEHHHESIMDEKACCGHKMNSLSFKSVLLHPMIHTGKIFIFIFGVTFLINFTLLQMGEGALERLLLNNTFFQPFLAALIGLIPNCAASVALTELYLKEFITYGSVIAGLCASGGLGLMVLFKEEKNKKNFLTVLILLFTISVLAGIIVGQLAGFWPVQ